MNECPYCAGKQNRGAGSEHRLNPSAANNSAMAQWNAVTLRGELKDFPITYTCAVYILYKKHVYVSHVYVASYLGKTK